MIFKRKIFLFSLCLFGRGDIIGLICVWKVFLEIDNKYFCEIVKVFLILEKQFNFSFFMDCRIVVFELVNLMELLRLEVEDNFENKLCIVYSFDDILKVS